MLDVSSYMGATMNHPQLIFMPGATGGTISICSPPSCFIEHQRARGKRSSLYRKGGVFALK